MLFFLNLWNVTVNTDLKNNNTKPTLDDIAFEGRNKEYGAYLIRKTYQIRLFRSFLFTSCAFLIFLFVFGRVNQNRTKYYYYNPFLDAQVVGVNLTRNPYTPNANELSGRAFSQTVEVPQEIADEEAVVTNQEKPVKPTTGKGDSTGIAQNESGLNGSGNSENTAGGVDGEIFGSADLNPQFPGGVKAMQEFIRENLQYPENARRSNITGTIHIYVVILKDGSITDIKVIRGLQEDLDKEAVRVIKSMPLWKPGMRGGIPVNVRCILPISVSPFRDKHGNS
jgi:protein TonB